MNNQSNTSSATNIAENSPVRKKLLDITNSIHAAQNIKQILVDLKAGILSLFNANSLTIYVVDKLRNEIYSMFLAGTQLKEIRLPMNNKSIAGYVANTGAVINIENAYSQKELKSIEAELSFDDSWDKKTGFKTRQILATPIYNNNQLMGVLQIINKKVGSGKFSEDEIGLALEISEVLGVAFYNQQRFVRNRKTRFDYLLSHDLIKENELEGAWKESREKKISMENLLMQKFKISKADIGHALEEAYNCRFIQYNDKLPIPGHLIKNLKKNFLRRELWVPLETIGDKIHVIIDDPNNIIKKDTIESLLKTKKIKYDVALEEDIVKYLNLFFASPDEEHSFTEILGKMDGDDGAPSDEEDVGEGVAETDNIIMQIVNKVINDAYNRRASDIHIEPNADKKNLEIRFRVDGVCFLYQTLPFAYRNAIISRIKIMSNLDITVKRLPQDGKIKFRRPSGDEFELRVVTIPTQGGMEDLVMRLLAKTLSKGEVMTLEEMALLPRNYKELVTICSKPYGMILCVGPSGCGKTTTLHAALHYVNKPNRKIWTAEDPVEITQYGLRQVQVQPKIGFNFAAAMRSFLRCDPDIIMVGEMRDFETAKIGVEASLTGHLVFTSLHTNSASETIVRLLDMGIDPLNFADALLGILAQRLVRTLCKDCRERYHPTEEEYEDIAEGYGREAFNKLNIPYNDDFKLYRPKGCHYCDNTGYIGRTALHELLIASDDIKRMVQIHETVEVMRDKAMSEGMTTLLQDGIQKAFEGLTDVTQVRRVCIK